MPAFLHHQDGQTTKLDHGICEKVAIPPDGYQLVGQASTVYDGLTKGKDSKEVRSIIKIWMRYTIDRLNAS